MFPMIRQISVKFVTHTMSQWPHPLVVKDAIWQNKLWAFFVFQWLLLKMTEKPINICELFCHWHFKSFFKRFLTENIKYSVENNTWDTQKNHKKFSFTLRYIIILIYLDDTNRVKKVCMRKNHTVVSIHIWKYGVHILKIGEAYLVR